MTGKRGSGRRFTLAIFAALLLTFAVPGGQLALAGGTPATGSVTDKLIHQEGSGGLTQYGDYVGASAGLNTYYSYFIEVPAGVSELNVQLFDADVGSNAHNNDLQNERDRAVSQYNTCARYTLYRPDGSQAADVAVGPMSGCRLPRPYGNCPTCDNAWWTLHTASAPQNGHWELRVDMSSAVTWGDDVNAYGIRAHDGAPGAGGTELNVYAASFLIVGINNNSRSRDYAVYPYVTSGCSADVNDFDWDAVVEDPYGSLSLSSRTGAFNHSNSAMSGQDVWQNNPFGGWTEDTSADDYGIWTGNITIDDIGTGNYGIVYLSDFTGDDPPPTSQPEAGTYRIYLPTDGGDAPAKPYVRQYLAHSAGPETPLMEQTTRFTVTVEVSNPVGSMGSITFSSPDNLVTAHVPGGEVLFAGNATATGTIVDQPLVGGSGDIVWDPGTVAPGAVAVLTYGVDVTPAWPAERIPVTGSPAANGTVAQYVDETGNASQPRAVSVFGPLCELTVTSSSATAVTLASFEGHPASAVADPVQELLHTSWAALSSLAGVMCAGGALLWWRRMAR
jgi:hypothetical protein